MILCVYKKNHLWNQQLISNKRGKVKRLFKSMSGASAQSDQTSVEVARDLIIRPATPNARSTA